MTNQLLPGMPIQTVTQDPRTPKKVQLARASTLPATREVSEVSEVLYARPHGYVRRSELDAELAAQRNETARVVSALRAELCTLRSEVDELR